MPIISTGAPFTQLDSNIGIFTAPSFNNNTPTTLHFNFSFTEAITQFTEVFIDEFYKKGLIKKNMTIVDIGAAMGLSALYFKDYAKMIYACEPFPDVYRSAVENTKEYKNIKLFNIGIAGSTRKDTLYGYDNAPAATIEKRDGVTSTFEAQFLSLDDFMGKNKIDHIDLLKVDCEGSEYEIFASSAFQTVSPRIDYIIGEAHWQPPYYPGYIPEMLKEAGFKTEWLPFQNLYRELHLDYKNGQKKTYRMDVDSIFFAKRIDN